MLIKWHLFKHDTDTVCLGTCPIYVLICFKYNTDTKMCCCCFLKLFRGKHIALPAFCMNTTTPVPAQSRARCDRGSLSSETGWRWGQMKYSELDSMLGLSMSYIHKIKCTGYSTIKESVVRNTQTGVLWQKWTLTHPRMLRQTLPLR